ncbi:MAG: ATP-binding protein [Candidatus Micrarchaeota archaeon]|nr:ATP-binding protein [Candidatus Micrarchaeota archaeon]
MKIIARKVFPKLLKEKGDRKITLLAGARQVGKTTLLRALHGEICTKGKKRGLFLDLDVFSNFEKVGSFDRLVNFLKLNGYEEGQRDFFYLFLDEVQRHPEMGMVMKNAYDTLANVKIYASGSSSIAIKDQAQESLAGRKNMTYVYPLDFEEYLWFLDDKAAIGQLANVGKLRGDGLEKIAGKLRGRLDEFLTFGGYPEVALQKTEKEKVAAIGSIFDMYIKRDLMEYMKAGDVLRVKKLLEYLAINHGQKMKYDEVCSICALSYNEAKEYLETLRETQIISIVSPFFTNKNKELVKVPKVYFVDSGARNYFMNNFNRLDMRGDAGPLLEGHVLSEMAKASGGKAAVNFWQDKNRREVDFIISGGKIVPVEVKFKPALKSDDFIGMRRFMADYPDVKKGYIVNMGRQGSGNGICLVLPYSVEALDAVG